VQAVTRKRRIASAANSAAGLPARGSLASFGTAFAHFAQLTSHLAGRPIAFLLAVLAVAVWLMSGPLFGYSDTWQLVINTGTTIVTFLMVFLIQNTQNRESLAVQLKLSELVLAMRDAEDRFATVEDLSDEELEALHDECRKRADHLLGTLEARRGPRSTARKRSARAASA
jgi:low affinity Fe/Cu permease